MSIKIPHSSSIGKIGCISNIGQLRNVDFLQDCLTWLGHAFKLPFEAQMGGQPSIFFLRSHIHPTYKLVAPFPTSLIDSGITIMETCCSFHTIQIGSTKFLDPTYNSILNPLKPFNSLQMFLVWFEIQCFRNTTPYT